ncbi:MAG: GNAT family N-acetyltransferase [Desulfovibrio sp.]
MYNPYSVGEYTYLRHPTDEDVEGRWHEWFSDENTTKWLGQYWPNSIEEQRRFFENCNSGKDRMVLSVIDKETDKHIGVCNLSSISWVNRVADLAIVIGEAEYRTGPYVLDAVSQLIRAAFLRLNMRMIKGGYRSINTDTESILKIFRFQEAGRFPGTIWHNGSYVDHVLVYLKREDWMRRNGLI